MLLDKCYHKIHWWWDSLEKLSRGVVFQEHTRVNKDISLIFLWSWWHMKWNVCAGVYSHGCWVNRIWWKFRQEWMDRYISGKVLLHQLSQVYNTERICGGLKGVLCQTKWPKVDNHKQIHSLYLSILKKRHIEQSGKCHYFLSREDKLSTHSISEHTLLVWNLSSFDLRFKGHMVGMQESKHTW